MFSETCECGKCFEKDNEQSARKALRMHKLNCKLREAAKETETKTETTKMLTSEQQAIAERVSAQDTDWSTIREDELEDFSLMDNPFDLPPEAARLQKEKVHAFRFCERKPDRIDYLTRSQQPPKRWWIVNKDSHPKLGYLVDPLIGGICVGDQILLFKPWWMHQKMKDLTVDLAEGQDNSGTLEGKQREMDNPDAGIEAYTGKSHKITGSDEVMGDEATIDSSLGISDDSGEMGDLVVAE